MAPAEHIRWFGDNVSWFEALDPSVLDLAVPNCEGWTVESVVNHLSFGLGAAYPAAMAAAPDADEAAAFAAVEWPEVWPSGAPALEAFATNMRWCADRFRATDPATPCWTYAGPGVAAFWFRRAAIESSIHLLDVADAIAEQPAHLDDERSTDAIAETMEFALPLGASIAGEPAGELRVDLAGTASAMSVGTGSPTATINGTPLDVLNALWGRHPERVDVDGDDALAHAWLSVIESAFAGRAGT